MTKLNIDIKNSSTEFKDLGVGDWFISVGDEIFIKVQGLAVNIHNGKLIRFCNSDTVVNINEVDIVCK